MLSRIKFEIEPLVKEMLDQLPASVWANDTTTFFDPAIGGGQFVRAIEQRLRECGHSNDNIRNRVFGFEESELHIRFAINKYKLVGQYAKMPYNKFFELDNSMKFDVVVGNPPYQDGTKEGQQNKIYNQLSKKALSLLKPTGTIAFITPSSVCKKSKRFSIVDNKNLVSVSFTPNNHFNVGVNICYWIIDKSIEKETCSVISANGEVSKFTNGSVIYDHGIYDNLIMNLKTSLKEFSSDPDLRMFLRNNPGPTKSKTQRSNFIFPLYNYNQSDITCFVKRQPYNFGKTKLVLSMTKSLKNEMVIVSDKDFDDSHVAVCVNNINEIANIKSFIFSDYFVNLSNQWKLIDGYGFNEAIKYLPVFDKTKSWTDTEVIQFLENFIQ